MRQDETIYTLIEENGQLLVRYEMAVSDRPQFAIGYWPVSDSLSTAPRRLLGKQLSDPGFTGRFSICSKDPDYFRLTGVVATLLHGGKTEAIRIDYQDVPQPKVRKGIKVRWYLGGWEKLLRTGWVEV